MHQAWQKHLFIPLKLAENMDAPECLSSRFGRVFPKNIWIEPFRKRNLKMLVLSRRKDESIMIGDDVEITIVDIRGQKVRLGITAPKNIPVPRREVYEAIQREKSEKKRDG